MDVRCPHCNSLESPHRCTVCGQPFGRATRPFLTLLGLTAAGAVFLSAPDLAPWFGAATLGAAWMRTAPREEGPAYLEISLEPAPPQGRGLTSKGRVKPLARAPLRPLEEILARADQRIADYRRRRKDARIPKGTYIVDDWEIPARHLV